jgi:hypothetical protein
MERVDRARIEVEVFIESPGLIIDGVDQYRSHAYYIGSLCDPAQCIE